MRYKVASALAAVLLLVLGVYGPHGARIANGVWWWYTCAATTSYYAVVENVPLAAVAEGGRPAQPLAQAVVPKRLHQTWKDGAVPARWLAAQRSCRDLHPEYEYKLWTDAEAEEVRVDSARQQGGGLTCVCVCHGWGTLLACMGGLGARMATPWHAVPRALTFAAAAWRGDAPAAQAGAHVSSCTHRSSYAPSTHGSSARTWATHTASSARTRCAILCCTSLGGSTWCVCACVCSSGGKGGGRRVWRTHM